MTLVLRYIARSARGLVRANTEVSVYAGARLLALADGMGGHAAGEVASQLVIGAMRELDDDEPGGDLLDKLDQATRRGNDAIAVQVARAPELDGMGTTLTAILFAGNRIGLCHIGDSRAYLYRDGQLTQITRDDTFVQTLVDEGQITAEQAHVHPQRSLIMRALTGQPVEPTLTVREARPGDRYLLCSDGLSDVVTSETLADTLGSVEDHRGCADRLIELALRGGGPDNVTVVVADVIDTEYGESRPIVGGAAGTDDETYTPDPATAAGRAAALRPPPAETRRPSIIDDEPPVKRNPLWKWLVIAAVALVVAGLVVGFFVVRAMFSNSHYAGVEDDKVVIFQGSPDKIAFLTFSDGAKRACVRDPDQDNPEVFFTDYSAESDCTALDISDLQEIDRNTLRSNVIRNKSLDEAEDAVRALNFLPMCAPPAPEPAPRDTRTPTPRGESETPESEAPKPGTPGPDGPTTTSAAPQTGRSQTGTSQTGAPGTLPEASTAASASIPEQRDDNGNKICRGTV